MPKLCFSFFLIIAAMLHLLLTSELSFEFPNRNKIISDTLSKNSRKSVSFTVYIRNKLTQLHYVSNLIKLSSKCDLFSAYSLSINFGKLCPLMLCNCFTEIVLSHSSPSKKHLSDSVIESPTDRLCSAAIYFYILSY